MTLRPEGVAQIERALHRGIRDGLAAFVLEEARRNAPVGDPATDPHAGRLRDVLRLEEAEDGSVLVVTSVPEALPNEYGTRFMPAHPFLTPAAIAGVAQAAELVAGPMRQELGQ